MPRLAVVERNTRETQISLTLNIDGTGLFEGQSGVPYLDHMLEQLAFHAALDLGLKAKGDLHIDCHHSVEDVGLALGEALDKALGDRKGIMRYAHCYYPMDETLVRAVLDFSGRPHFHFSGTFAQPALGALDTQMISHFFKSVAMQGRFALHLAVLYGENDHHKSEGLFKAFARSLRQAAELDPKRKGVSSTKGVL